MIRYKLKRTELERELELLGAVYEEVRARQPDGLRCATFQLDDEVSFVDFAEGDDLPEPLPRLDAFRRYRAGLDDRCQEGPVMTELREVGSYGFH